VANQIGGHISHIKWRRFGRYWVACADAEISQPIKENRVNRGAWRRISVSSSQIACIICDGMLRACVRAFDKSPTSFIIQGVEGKGAVTLKRLPRQAGFAGALGQAHNQNSLA
jgi:hypothetical protein